MSKRTLFRRRSSAISFLCGGLLFVLLLSFAPATQGATVSLGRINMACWITGYYNLPIELTQTGNEIAIGGFDLLIAYPSFYLTMLGASKGGLLDTCGWEYFTCRSDVTDSLGLVRVVAVADINNGNQHPSCFLQGTSGVLAEIAFHVEPSADCMAFNPVRFLWNDCGDNVVSSVMGDSMYFALNVYDSIGSAPLPTPTSLPSWNGAPASCLSGSSTRRLDFVNGGFDFVCCDPIEPRRGDLNLNDIACEVGDLVIYYNYFIQGIDALDHNPALRDLQIAASDVNADGVALTFRDMIYLYRVIIGDALPQPRPAAGAANAVFSQDPVGKTVSVSYGENLAGVLLVFQGLINPTILWPAGQFPSGGYQNPATNTTTVIVFGAGRDSCGCGTIINYTGTGTLQHVETTDWFDSQIATTINIGAGSDCGDVDASGFINITDASYLVNYIFGGGPAPADSHHGDVNCDGMCNISDVIYLVSYIFAGGPAPCNGC